MRLLPLQKGNWVQTSPLPGRSGASLAATLTPGTMACATSPQQHFSCRVLFSLCIVQPQHMCCRTAEPCGKYIKVCMFLSAGREPKFCWQQGQLSSFPQWGLQCSSVPQTWTLPRLFLLWPWATDLRVCPWWPRCEGTEILAGSSPRHVLPFILAHEEALHTGREAKQKGTARPAYCKVVKLVLEFWALKIIWVVWRGVGRGRSSYLPARISSLASWGYVSKFFSSAAGTRK